jgi:hypothetical protein
MFDSDADQFLCFCLAFAMRLCTCQSSQVTWDNLALTRPGLAYGSKLVHNIVRIAGMHTVIGCGFKLPV